jgi:cyclomaltodextrinase / maltogenic alpha-amylase / neopullulanase
MRAQFGAHFGSLALCGLLLVACASDGTNKGYVHSKARKSDAAPAGVAPSPAPVVTRVPPAPAPVAAPPTVPPPVSPIPALPAAAPPIPVELPSEIPVRAPRRDKPSWDIPTPKAPAPRISVPVPVPVPVLPAPPAVSAPVVIAKPTVPVAPTISPPPPPIAPAVVALPKPQATPATNTPLIIDRATGAREARLPCNRAASPHCDLRIYQVNVGTFVDGSPDHNPISGYGPGPHTGDIEGVTGALEHIKALGFNAIWLTPIFDTAAGQPQSRPAGPPQVNAKLDGTGYFPRDYFKIDPQFGTLEQTEAMIAQARLLGLKVLFDGVFGHHKGNVTPAPSGARPVDATSPSAYDGRLDNYPGRIVNFDDARSTAFYKEVARYWIETLGIDGWRLDQVYQVPAGPLRDITGEITRAANSQLLSGYVVGEMWGSAAQIRDVLGPSTNPALGSAFDFPTRYALVQALASDENGGTGKPASTINEAWALGAHASYPDHAIMNLMLGNHDLVRFGDLIERAGKGGPTSPNYWAIHKMAFTFMAAWSGPITLYYGEEIGAEVTGFSAKVASDCARVNQCDDHVGRNMVMIPGVNTPMSASTAPSRDLKLYLTSLMSLRAANPALSAGSRTHVYSDKDLYIDLKTHGADRYILVMNTGTGTHNLTLRPAALGMRSLRNASVAAGQTGIETSPEGLVLNMPALGAAIIKLEGT